jgi:hypothetical protein
MSEDLRSSPLCEVADGGAKGTRTPGLLRAKQTLFQLSYSPALVPG